ncbi:hypothetical protein PBCV1_a550bL [Paramecium bursaria Chlorella virus 1]|uniref:Uncharacterized protein n=1 Tax=Paramecium bursaria Chlorella virus 1 TaxID=10506 RepID=F8TU55_PBCV1|nr:hypothetical protein PBCV1_a550bL [Paramecium bursaria Chlorella virus 1]AEI70116.1 hypothetical protein [Paramecium bursaria Chlorella virus 1]
MKSKYIYTYLLSFVICHLSFVICHFFLERNFLQVTIIRFPYFQIHLHHERCLRVRGRPRHLG